MLTAIHAWYMHIGKHTEHSPIKNSFYSHTTYIPNNFSFKWIELCKSWLFGKLRFFFVWRRTVFRTIYWAGRKREASTQNRAWSWTELRLCTAVRFLHIRRQTVAAVDNEIVLRRGTWNDVHTHTTKVYQKFFD